jgi:chromosome segregation ATPase
MIELILGAAVIVVAGLAMTKKGRYLLKGTMNMFFVDVAKTPKGAETIYTQAIEEAQDNYNKASNNFQKITGMLETSKRNYNEANIKMENTKRTMQSLAGKGQLTEDKIKVYKIELQSIDDDINTYGQEIQEYTPMFNDAKTLTENYELQLVQLQKDKKNVVRKLEMNQQTKQMYDDLDELKKEKTSSKLVAAVKEGVTESGEMATGARVLHESKHSTQLAALESESKGIKFDDFLSGLKSENQKQLTGSDIKQIDRK